MRRIIGIPLPLATVTVINAVGLIAEGLTLEPIAAVGYKPPSFVVKILYHVKRTAGRPFAGDAVENQRL